jgi:ABC-type sulfate/molybdate transport systems ATPase subunit
VLEADVAASVGTLELDVQLAVGKEAVLLAGPNGAGKSTLLRMLLGILPPQRGRIALDGRTLFDGRIDLPPEERRLGYVPQDSALFSHLDVAGNVGFGLRRAERAARAREVLEALEISHLARRRVETLSGGERQRVALARALAPRPRALLLDEPFAALDAQARPQLRQYLAQRLSALGLPALVVSHDPADASLGQRIVVLEHGRVVQQGTLAQLRAQPATPFVSELAAG